MIKDDKPLVSFVIPTYNRVKFLAGRSFPSVLNQTYSNWECIIVDDCSIDNTPKFLKKLKEKDNRVRVFRLPNNKGAAAATNYGFRRAKGQFIAILEDDDEYSPDFLEETVSLIRKLPKDYGAVGCGVLVVFGDSGMKNYGKPSLDSSFYTSLSSGWLFRKEVFSEKGLFYDEEISPDADTDLGIRFFEVYKAEIIDKPLFVRHVRSDVFDRNGLTSISEKRIIQLRKFLSKCLRKIEKKSSRKDLVHIYNRVGRTFILGGSRKEGIHFLKLAFKAKPSLRNLAHLLVAHFGFFIYKNFFYLERFMIMSLRSVFYRLKYGESK